MTSSEIKTIFDVLNVYDPNDIQHVYPKMGTEEFLRDVRSAWEKVGKIIQCLENSPNLNVEWDRSSKRLKVFYLTPPKEGKTEKGTPFKFRDIVEVLTLEGVERVVHTQTNQ